MISAGALELGCGSSESWKLRLKSTMHGLLLTSLKEFQWDLVLLGVIVKLEQKVRNSTHGQLFPHLVEHVGVRN
jgi:hypothetical protein